MAPHPRKPASSQYTKHDRDGRWPNWDDFWPKQKDFWPDRKDSWSGNCCAPCKPCKPCKPCDTCEPCKPCKPCKPCDWSCKQAKPVVYYRKPQKETYPSTRKCCCK